ncbi:MAG: hypothetical protein JF599_10045 [Verrucomicrobia bacterium]|nr:hypothetical protein [Verrucomicrobiota bacterium]
MASLTKTERALQGPGIFEITLGVVFSIALGVILSALYLIFKTVETAKEMPKEPVIGAVYFLEGSSASGKAHQWGRKHQLLVDGGTADITFTEDELNAWMASVMPKAAVKPPAAKAPAGKAAPAAPKTDGSTAFVVPDQPNFRIRDGVLQVGVPATVNVFGASLPLIVQTRGHFEHGQESFVFKADELYIGSLPAHRIPGLTGWITRRAVAEQDIPDDLRAAWRKLSLVAVEGNVLHLSLP